MSAYRYAVLGCGGISHWHANAYANRPSIRLVAAAEVDPERSKTFAERHAVPRMYTDYQELLEGEKPHIVSICTWPPLHAEMAVAAAENGVLAVHCEKPMAVSLGECKRMLKACDDAGAKLVIGHNHRWDPNALKAKELVRDGAIGKLLWIYGYCGDRDLLANGTHVVDLIRFLNDDALITHVIGQMDRPTPKTDFGHEVEHGAIVHFYFENGVRAFVEQGTVAPKPYAFQLVGTDGVIFLNAPEGYTMRIVTTKGEIAVELERWDTKRKEVDALLAWMEGGEPHPARGANGFVTHQVLMAAYESSRLHRAVYMPYQADEFPLLRMIREGLVP